MRDKLIWLILLLFIEFGSAGSVSAFDNVPLLGLRVGDQRFTGRVLQHNDQTCWFLGRDGRLQQFSVNNVSDFSKIGDQFKAQSAAEFKVQLQNEFGKSFEIRTSNHYVVVSRPGRAEKYAEIMEQIYREFVRSFRARGFRLTEPEFPMVAIVLPDASAFARYCEQEKAPLQPAMVGFYLSSSNRIVMYERPNVGEIDNTVIHEATHQVAFNTGIHSRLARHPRWVVEGLATVFEAEGIRSRQGTTTPSERVNRERFLWFQDYMKSRRTSNSLEQFLSNDDLFGKTALDAYSEAWALSFFLVETHPSGYAKYLKRLVDRDPLASYDATSRVKDFTDQFGTDLDGFESTYLKFIKRTAER